MQHSASFTTPDLCDEFPHDVVVVDPIFKNYGGISSFYGGVVTVKCFEDNSLVKEQLSRPGNGRVLVVDGGGSKRCALLGDQLAGKAKKNGWAGLLIYGCIRDVDIIAQIKVGVQCLGAHPKKTIKRGIGDLNVPVTFGGVTFTAGDYVYADNNGIVVSNKALI